MLIQKKVTCQKKSFSSLVLTPILTLRSVKKFSPTATFSLSVTMFNIFPIFNVRREKGAKNRKKIAEKMKTYRWQAVWQKDLGVWATESSRVANMSIKTTDLEQNPCKCGGFGGAIIVAKSTPLTLEMGVMKRAEKMRLKTAVGIPGAWFSTHISIILTNIEF